LFKGGIFIEEKKELGSKIFLVRFGSLHMKSDFYFYFWFKGGIFIENKNMNLEEKTFWLVFVHYT